MAGIKKNNFDSIKKKFSKEAEYKADRFSIGGFTTSDFEFTSHQIKIQPNDLLYLFSDGFEDQLGGESPGLKSKKY